MFLSLSSKRVPNSCPFSPVLQPLILIRHELFPLNCGVPLFVVFFYHSQKINLFDISLYGKSISLYLWIHNNDFESSK